MGSIRIYAPDGVAGPAQTNLASIPDSLGGRRIVVLDNGKPGAEELLTGIAEQLRDRTGGVFAGLRRKGSAATPCEDPLLDRIVGEADLVLTGTAD